jgi:uncharacterized protein YdaU (DUF1376 family)
MRPTKEIVLFYFPFNYGDFSQKTAGLSDKHKLAYLQLVAQYFQQERCLDDPTKRLALKTGIKDEQEMFELLYATFEQRTDGWFDDDIEAAITKGVDPLSVKCAYEINPNAICITYAATTVKK